MKEIEVKEHEVKLHPGYIRDIVNGKKQFEYLKNDRDYRVGDMVTMREYNLDISMFTGMWIIVRIKYILHSRCGIPDGYCAFYFDIMDYYGYPNFV